MPTRRLSRSAGLPRTPAAKDDQRASLAADSAQVDGPAVLVEQPDVREPSPDGRADLREVERGGIGLSTGTSGDTGTSVPRQAGLT